MSNDETSTKPEREAVQPLGRAGSHSHWAFIRHWSLGVSHCFSYSPLLTRFSTVKPAFFASEIETVFGELNVDQTLRTGLLQAGHWVRGAAETGRRKVNFPPHTLHSPSQSSYSYNGITYFFRKGPNKSIGTGRNVVVLCSLEISRIVCRNLSCRAIGSLLIIAAACTIFSAA